MPHPSEIVKMIYHLLGIIVPPLVGLLSFLAISVGSWLFLSASLSAAAVARGALSTPEGVLRGQIASQEMRSMRETIRRDEAPRSAPSTKQSPLVDPPYSI